MSSTLTDGIHRSSFTPDAKLHTFHVAESPRGIVLTSRIQPQVLSVVGDCKNG